MRLIISRESLNRLAGKNIEIYSQKEMKTMLRKKFPGLSVQEENVLLGKCEVDVQEVLK